MPQFGTDLADACQKVKPDHPLFTRQSDSTGKVVKMLDELLKEESCPSILTSAVDQMDIFGNVISGEVLHRRDIRGWRTSRHWMIESTDTRTSTITLLLHRY